MNVFIFVIIEFQRKKYTNIHLILPLSFPKRSPNTVFCCAFLLDFEIFVRTGPCSMNLHQTKQNIKITLQTSNQNVFFTNDYLYSLMCFMHVMIKDWLIVLINESLLIYTYLFLPVVVQCSVPPVILSRLGTVFCPRSAEGTSQARQRSTFQHFPAENYLKY